MFEAQFDMSELQLCQNQNETSSNQLCEVATIKIPSRRRVYRPTSAYDPNSSVNCEKYHRRLVRLYSLLAALLVFVCCLLALLIVLLVLAELIPTPRQRLPSPSSSPPPTPATDRRRHIQAKTDDGGAPQPHVRPLNMDVFNPADFRGFGTGSGGPRPFALPTASREHASVSAVRANHSEDWTELLRLYRERADTNPYLKLFKETINSTLDR